MKSQVKLVADADGNVIRKNSNGQFYAVAQSLGIKLVNGFPQADKRSALIKGTEKSDEKIKMFFDYHGLKGVDGEVIPRTAIQITESLEGHESDLKRYPEGHEMAGEPVTDADGNAIYRVSELLNPGQEPNDTFISSASSVGAEVAETADSDATEA